MTHEGTRPRVMLRHNQTCVPQRCPLCSREHRDAGVPYWFFVDRTPLCHDCAEAQAPELFRVLTRSEVAQRLGYRGPLRDEGDE